MKNLVKSMNQLLADLNVLYRKLQNYHWNIKGKEFFVLHAKLEEYYDGVNEQIDEVAEKILMLEGQPLGTLKDYLELTGLKEAANEKVGAEVVFETVAKDFEYIKKALIAVKEEADKEDCYEVSALMGGYIDDYSKNIWMLKQSR